jgi:hypothetical protein
MHSSPDEALEEQAEKLYDVMTRSVATRSNETELREDVEGAIRDALRDLYGTDLAEITAETNTKAKGAGYSPVDKIYGGVLVEYEWKMDAGRRRHGAQQALDYLKNLESSQGAAGAFTAVVCDGRQWGFLIEHPGDELDLFSAAPASADEHFEWRPNSAAACRRFLQLCGSHRKSPVTGLGLANGFGPTRACL